MLSWTAWLFRQRGAWHVATPGTRTDRIETALNELVQMDKKANGRAADQDDDRSIN
jgi:hypothetical protein